MRLKVIASLQGLEELKPEWFALFQRCPRATPFQSPQWLLPWIKHLFQGGQIRALAMYDEQELIRFAPLFCWGIQQRTVAFLGAGVSDYGDLIFSPGMESECVAMVWTFLQNSGKVGMCSIYPKTGS